MSPIVARTYVKEAPIRWTSTQQSLARVLYVRTNKLVLQHPGDQARAEYCKIGRAKILVKLELTMEKFDDSNGSWLRRVTKAKYFEQILPILSIVIRCSHNKQHKITR